MSSYSPVFSLLNHKRILQVVPSLTQGGVEKGSLEIAEAIIAAGGKAFIASSGGPMVSELEHLGGIHFSLPLNAKNPLTLMMNSYRLKKLIQEHSIDLVHARSRAPAWSAFWAARLENIPFITTFHGTYNYHTFPKKYYNSIMVRGARVIAISDFIHEHILRHYRSYVEPVHIQTIPRGADLSLFNLSDTSLETRVRNLRKNWEIYDASPLLLLPARLTRWKGQAIALRAISLLRDFKGLLILLGSDKGHQSYTQELLALAQSLDISDRVRIISHCSDMPAAYVLADLVLHTSTDPEAFGRIIAEAQAMGRCVIATNHGAPPEIIEEGVTGFLTQPGDSEELARKIKDFLTLPLPHRKQIGQKAVERIRCFFSKDQMVEKTLAIYTELLTEKVK